MCTVEEMQIHIKEVNYQPNQAYLNIKQWHVDMYSQKAVGLLAIWQIMQ